MEESLSKAQRNLEKEKHVIDCCKKVTKSNLERAKSLRALFLCCEGASLIIGETKYDSFNDWVIDQNSNSNNVKIVKWESQVKTAAIIEMLELLMPEYKEKLYCISWTSIRDTLVPLAANNTSVLLERCDTQTMIKRIQDNGRYKTLLSVFKRAILLAKHRSEELVPDLKDLKKAQELENSDVNLESPKWNDEVGKWTQERFKLQQISKEKRTKRKPSGEQMDPKVKKSRTITEANAESDNLPQNGSTPLSLEGQHLAPKKPNGEVQDLESGAIPGDSIGAKQVSIENTEQPGFDLLSQSSDIPHQTKPGARFVPEDEMTNQEDESNSEDSSVEEISPHRSEDHNLNSHTQRTSSNDNEMNTLRLEDADSEMLDGEDISLETESPTDEGSSQGEATSSSETFHAKDDQVLINNNQAHDDHEKANSTDSNHNDQLPPPNHEVSIIAITDEVNNMPEECQEVQDTMKPQRVVISEEDNPTEESNEPRTTVMGPQEVYGLQPGKPSDSPIPLPFDYQFHSSDNMSDDEFSDGNDDNCNDDAQAKKKRKTSSKRKSRTHSHKKTSSTPNGYTPRRSTRGKNQEERHQDDLTNANEQPFNGGSFTNSPFGSKQNSVPNSPISDALPNIYDEQKSSYDDWKKIIYSHFESLAKKYKYTSVNLEYNESNRIASLNELENGKKRILIPFHEDEHWMLCLVGLYHVYVIDSECKHEHVVDKIKKAIPEKNVMYLPYNCQKIASGSWVCYFGEIFGEGLPLDDIDPSMDISKYGNNLHSLVGTDDLYTQFANKRKVDSMDDIDDMESMNDNNYE